MGVSKFWDVSIIGWISILYYVVLSFAILEGSSKVSIMLPSQVVFYEIQRVCL